VTTAVRPVTLDTDVASAAFKRKQLPILTRITGMDWVISFVTFGELAKWVEIRDWAPHNRRALDLWTAQTPILHSTDAIAKTWGRLSAEATKRGRPRPQNDMWTAAVCITLGIPLATLNLKDFEDFEAHHGLELVRV